MPRTARFRIAAIGELLRQLGFAPSETRHRQMESAEAFVAEVDPERNYPEEFVVYRITGFRPEGGDAPVTFVGAALRGDLVNFVLQLSAGLALPARTEHRTALTMEEAAQRLRVSTKSIQRYRRQGLVCHFVMHEDGVPRLACFEDALQRFQSREPTMLAEAAAFSRVDAAIEGEMFEEARAMRRERGATLNEAALIIARRHGRSHEGVRLLLARCDRRAPTRVFDDPPPLTRAEARRFDRAARCGVDVSRLAERFARTRATIRRVLDRERADVLRGYDVRAIHLATFDRPDARKVILSAPAIARELTAIPPHADAALLVAALRAAPAFDADAALALLAGYNFLKREAAAGLASLPNWPKGPALDRIETDLRWAALVKRKLVALLLPIALMRIEITLDRPLMSEPSERVIAMLRLAVDIASKQVESINPGTRQKSDRVYRMAMDRVLAALDPAAGASRRAAARHAPGAVPMPRLFDELCSWQSRLLLSPRHEQRLADLDERSRLAMEYRYGLHGDPPRSVVEIAINLAMPTRAVARRLNSAEARVRRLQSAQGE